MPISAKKNSLRRRVLQAFFETLRAFGADQRVGIFAVRKKQKQGLTPVAHARQHRFDRAPRGLTPRAVAVEAEVHIGALAKKNLGMIARRRGAERRDRLRHAELMQADRVHVAFDDDQARDLLVCLAHLPEPEQFAALVEERRLGRIEIFRRVFPDEHAPAERDRAAATVENRKHHAAAEAIVFRAALAAGEKPGFLHERDALRARAERVLERVPLIRRVAEIEFRDRRVVEPAVGEVRARGFVRAELAAEERRRGFEHGVKVRRVFARRLASAFVGHLDAGAARELFDCVGKFEAVVIHEEADRAPVRAAAEAVIELLGGAHGERRRTLVVERAARGPVAAGLFERHAFLDHVDDVDAGEEVVDEFFGDAAAHGIRMPRPSISFVVPAKAGTERLCSSRRRRWVPAFAGMTDQEPSFRLTASDTLPMSALPATCGRTRPITLPISFALAAPESAIAFAMIASISASPSCAGM